MKNLAKKIIWGVPLYFLPSLAHAFCPVCTIAVGAGIGLSRWLKIDDTVTGIWIGAFILSSAFWTNNWFIGRGVKIRGQLAIIIVLYYVLILLPLYRYGIIGHPLNTFLGTDKIIFGTLIGSLSFSAVGSWYHLIKTKRGKPHFAFQKVIMPVSALLLLSIAMYLITKVH